MRPRCALIVGGGPAGLSAALLLKRQGWLVDVVSRPAAAGPVVVLNEVTQRLLNDVWGWGEPALIQMLVGAHPIAERLVAWQPDAPPSLVRQSAVAVPLSSLTTAMIRQAAQHGIHCLPPGAVHEAAYTWVIRAAGRRSVPVELQQIFGARHALSASVQLHAGAQSDRCTLETVPGGWVFLIPQGEGKGTVQAMSSQASGLSDDEADTRLQAMVRQTRFIAEAVEAIHPHVQRYAAMPSLNTCPATLGDIAIGDAAMAYDPISGDGIGAGLRSAILAVAVMDAIQAGKPAQDCLDHYTHRLEHAAQAHVLRCVDLYGSACGPREWRAEIAAMTTGLTQLPSEPRAFRFELRSDARPQSRAVVPALHSI